MCVWRETALYDQQQQCVEMGQTPVESVGETQTILILFSS